jgi:protein-S-isoprenylcysteine O-methyltransferase Ste14
MRPSLTNQLISFVLPVLVLIIVPALILWPIGFRIGWGLGLPWDACLALLGAALIGTGLYWFSRTIRLFMAVGRGTLAPWSPTQKLVVAGPYCHMRNPMITSVLAVLLGESILLGSLGILIWFVVAFAVNHVYFIFSEEPGLVKRFGEDYLVYKRNVPRWIPRVRPWSGEDRRSGR